MIKDQRDNISDLWHAFLEKQKGTALLWYVVALCIGIAWYFSLSFEPQLSYLACAFLLTTVIAFFARHHSLYRFLTYVLLMIALGANLAAWRTQSLATVLLHKDLKGQTIIGSVDSFEPSTSGWRVILNDLEFENLRGQEAPKKIRLTLRQKDYQPTYQQRISVYARVMAPSAPMVPGVYDFQRHAYFQGIGGYGFSLGHPEILKEGIKEKGFLFSLRQNISSKILDSQPQPSGGVINALLTGQRKTIYKDITENLRDAGLAHLLAISGLHVGLLAGIIFYFTRMGLVIFVSPQKNWPIKKISAFIALLSSIAYMLIVGAPVSTQRAVIMTGLVLIAVMTDRRAITLRLVGIAGFIILIFQPESLMQPAFQMSFSAVIGLVAFYRASEPYLYQMRTGAGWFKKSFIYIAGVIVTTFVAELSTAPFVLYHFQQVTIYGFLANMVAMPIMAFWVMPAGVVSYLSMMVGLEQLPLALMGYGVNAICIIAQWVAHIDGAVKYFPAEPVSVLISLSIGFITLCFLKGKWRLIGVFPLIVGIVISFLTPTPIALITDSGKIMGYVPQERSAFLMLSDKGDNFTRQLLRQLVGRNDTTAWTTTTDSAGLTCDDWGCLAKRQNKTLAFVEHPAALARDCQTADLVIATFPIGWECKTKVIDRFDLWRHGGYIVYPKGSDDFIVKSVNQSRGVRPWTDKPKPKYN